MAKAKKELDKETNANIENELALTPEKLYKNNAIAVKVKYL